MFAAIAGGATASLRLSNFSSSSSSPLSTARRNSSSSSNGEHQHSGPLISWDRDDEILKKWRDWYTFRQYLRTHHPTLSPADCGGAVVVDFLRYFDGFGDTEVHAATCPNFGIFCRVVLRCDCPTRQHWTRLSDLVGHLSDAFEDTGGSRASNPFDADDVTDYLINARASQKKWRWR